MTEFTCLRCGSAFERKEHLVNHISRKKPCPPDKSDMSLKEVGEQLGLTCQVFECEFCDKKFATKHRLDSHVKNYVCRKNQLVPVNTLNVFQNSTINIQNNFNFNVFTAEGKRNFGEEDLSYITPERVKTYLKMDPIAAILKCIDDIYHNPNAYANQTVSILPNNPEFARIVDQGNVRAAPASEQPSVKKDAMHS